MKSNFKWILVGSLAFLVQVGFAQEKTFKGTVSEGGLPLPGVSVTISGTTEGTQTDLDGKYSLKVNKGDVIIYSFVGMKDIKHTVGTEGVYNVTMLGDDEMLEEVVVTALGIKRDKKKLGYSSQEVKGENLSDAGQANAVNALSGNVSGIQVTSPSSMGGSTRIVMRGIKSVTGNNQPLIVIDGVPLDNSNFANTNTQRGSGGRDYGDATGDINPADIESVTVLKGGPASALYGARAGNGAIIYTTKTAKNGKVDIEFNTGLSFESINIMPDLQNSYGGGISQTFKKQMINGKEYNLADYAADESWGPKFDGTMYLPWNAFDKEFANDYMKEIAWEASKNDVKKYFRTGITRNNSFAIGKSYQDASVRMSFNNSATDGILPNSKLTRNNFSVNASAKLSEKLKAEGNVSYVHTKGFNRPEVGYGDNSVAKSFFQWNQRQLDYKDLKDYKLANGQQRTWNRTSWSDGTPKYMDNPYWTAHMNTSSDVRTRTFGNAKLTYNFTPELYAVGTVYADSYSLTVEERTAVGSKKESKYYIAKRNVSEFNYEGRIHYDKNLTDFTFNIFAGVNRSERKRDHLIAETQGGLILPDLFTLKNAKGSISDNASFHRRVNSIFGSASIGYKEFLFLDLTTRTDWFSTVTTSSTYNSATGSFIFSNIINNAPWLNFGKLRLGWAQVGNDTSEYQLADYFNIEQAFNGDPMYSSKLQANNPNIKPETLETKEIGLEASLFNNRVGFEVSYYDILTKDLITPLEIDAATGYTSKVGNAGEMQNRGLEATLNLVPIKKGDFQWDVTWNFAKNKNKLKSLYDGAETLELAKAPFRVRLMAQVDQPYGQIFGTDYVYDDNGNKVIDSNGLYKATTDLKPLGSVLPDFNMGIRNSFKYKNFRFGFLIDIQKGGHYFSTTHMYGMSSGMLQATVDGNIRETGVILEGVTADGKKNEKVITGQDYSKGFKSTVDAQNVFNADYIKLREVTLGYDLPSKWIGPFKGIQLSVFARNLFTWNLDWKGMDPEMASYGSGNIQGLEGGSLPSTRNYGFNVKFKF
jgi:TonB-linked SusC/RagA family outer membrane protein